jgi:hypothetical protein
VFERFTESAIATIDFAQQEARRLGHNFVGTEFILLGLLHGSTGAALGLQSLGIRLEPTRLVVKEFVGRGSGMIPAKIPFTQRAKQVLQQSLDMALQYDHIAVRTEHLLLTLLNVESAIAYRVLQSMEVDFAELFDRVAQRLPKPFPCNSQRSPIIQSDFSPTHSSSPRRALVVQNNFSPFGNKLVQSGYVNSDQMKQALVDSRKSGRSLLDVLESLTGQQLPPDLIRQYKKQQLFELKILYGVEALDPEINQIPAGQIGDLIGTLIPIDMCRDRKLIPLSKGEEYEKPYILVAMVNPDDLTSQDDLNRVLRPKGLALQRLVISNEDYQRLISSYLNEQVEIDIDADLEGLGYMDLQDVQDEADLNVIDLQDVPDETKAEADLNIVDADAAVVIALANKIMIKALQERVSYIHIEPQEQFLRVRFRKDGVLREAFDRPFPKKIIPAVTDRFKIMADLDIAERSLPQDGRILYRYDNRNIDFRVSTVPSKHGEKVVLQILDNSDT